MYQRARDWLGGLLCAVAFVGVSVSLASAAEHGGGGGLISLDSSLIVQIVNFVILLVLLQRLLYKPLVAKMQERTVAIKRALEEAQAARAEAARQHEENAERLRAALAEAAAIREQALKETAEEQRRLLEAARAESQRLIESSKAQMNAEIRRAREELRREVAELATSIAEKLIRKSLREGDHRRIVDDAIARIGA